LDSMPHSSFRGEVDVFSFEYNLYPNNVLEITYYNKVTKHTRVYRIYFDKVISIKMVEEACELAKKLYRIVKAGVAKPNIPLYTILLLLNRNVPGFSYKCKIKKKNCPIQVYRVIDDKEIRANTSSLLEQMYRVIKKYPVM